MTEHISDPRSSINRIYSDPPASHVISTPGSGDVETWLTSGQPGVFKYAGMPLDQAFASASKQNSLYRIFTKGKGRYTSPLFRLVQRLRSHPDLKGIGVGRQAGDVRLDYAALRRPM
jgi:hypothetical protein